MSDRGGLFSHLYKAYTPIPRSLSLIYEKEGSCVQELRWGFIKEFMINSDLNVWAPFPHTRILLMSKNQLFLIMLNYYIDCQCSDLKCHPWLRG